MKCLKPGVDLSLFISAVQQCRGDVLFQTEDGDSLNLKSILSRYLFSMISNNQIFLLSGAVVCRVEGDYQLLSDFIQERS